jgi:two-component system NtrC family sensor kinase
VTGRILVLDDSLTVRMNLTEAFEAAGLLPAPCSTVAEARALLAQEAFDVIILDVLLPDGDGIEFLREIRADPLNASAAVLMLSSEAEVKDRIRGLRTGADDYVGKPYDIGYVVAKARDLIHSRTGSDGDVAPILVIDDSLTVCRQLTEVLEQSGYRVVVAHTGEEGLRLAASRRPIAVVVDGSLPDIDGGMVVRRLRMDAALRSIPCLLLTGSDDHGAELMALDAGADAFVRKEQGAAVVVAKLSALLRQVMPATGVGEATSLMDPKKILAVDDSITFLHGIADLIRNEGYDVVAAHSGEEALELLEVERVDCILLDLMMPGMSGQETCKRLKTAQALRDVPLIMLTSTDDRQTMIEALAAGADDFISKASEFSVIAARIRAQLRRKQFEDENRRIREELLCREIEATEARAEAQIAQTKAAMVEELERKNRELEAFSYSVSHDLRAPLRTVDGFTKVLIESVSTHLDDTGIHYADRIKAAVARMTEMIDDMLELARVGRAQLVRFDIDLAPVATRILADLAEGDPDRRVEIVVASPMAAVADPRLLRNVLENLLGNAWKFTAKTPEAIVEVGSEQVDGTTVHFVRDNGDGFDMASAEKLFSPFQRLHSQSDFPGTGIGLATVHRIIDRHGGRVWAESEVGRGAVFRFTLPT